MKIYKTNMDEHFKFYKSIYQNDENFKDNKSDLLFLVNDEKMSFRKNSIQEFVKFCDDDGTTYASALLIIHKNAKETLFISFFEALKNADLYVNELLLYAEKMANEHGAKKMTIGIDGHINNAVGFPKKAEKLSFSENMCKEYYHDYFLQLDKICFKSFTGSHQNAKHEIDKDVTKFQKIFKRFETEFGDFKKDYENTIKRYNSLNNIIFSEHPYYYNREISEDFDMFCDFKTVLKKENIIFVTHKGKDVGFMFLYPDFNENVKRGEKIGIKTVIRSLFNKYKTIKIMEIGVLPEYRQYGLVLLLFHKAIHSIPKSINKIISSWIIETNHQSLSVTKRYAKNDYKEFYIYEKTFK